MGSNGSDSDQIVQVGRLISFLRHTYTHANLYIILDTASYKTKPEGYTCSFGILDQSRLSILGPLRGFGDLGRMAISFQGAGEQTHCFGDLGSTVKK